MEQDYPPTHIKIDLKNGYLEIKGPTSLVNTLLPLIKQMGDVLTSDQGELTHTESSVKYLQLQQHLHKEIEAATQTEKPPPKYSTEKYPKPKQAFYNSELNKTEIYYIGIFQYLLSLLSPNDREKHMYEFLLYFLMLIDPKRSISIKDMQVLADLVNLKFYFSANRMNELLANQLVQQDEDGGYELSFIGEENLLESYRSHITKATRMMREHSSLKFD